MIPAQDWLQSDARLLGELRQGCFIVEGDVPFNRLQCQSAIHGAAFQVHVAQLARQSGCKSTLSGPGGAVNGNDQLAGNWIGHLRV